MLDGREEDEIRAELLTTPHLLNLKETYTVVRKPSFSAFVEQVRRTDPSLPTRYLHSAYAGIPEHGFHPRHVAHAIEYARKAERWDAEYFATPLDDDETDEDRNEDGNDEKQDGMAEVFSQTFGKPNATAVGVFQYDDTRLDG